VVHSHAFETGVFHGQLLLLLALLLLQPLQGSVQALTVHRVGDAQLRSG
jgi:hypothetical protein